MCYKYSWTQNTSNSQAQVIHGRYVLDYGQAVDLCILFPFVPILSFMPLVAGNKLCTNQSN